MSVCTGNICRSPTAEGVAKKLANEQGLAAFVEFDSVGTHDYHIGDTPDQRTIAAAARRGYDLGALRAHQIDDDDFERFDLVLAMDDANHAHLLGRCPPALRHRIKRLLDFVPRADVCEVPDPYYGGSEEFERVLVQPPFLAPDHRAAASGAWLGGQAGFVSAEIFRGL